MYFHFSAHTSGIRSRALLPGFGLLLSVLTLGTGCDPKRDPVDGDSGGVDVGRDADGDGHPVTEDCDDTDPSVYEGAPDVWYDGIDSDCAGDDDYDADRDGYDRGVDCDDADPLIHPGGADAWYDGVDGDCAGDDDYDADGDGYPLELDCDDTDPMDVPDADGACGDTTGPSVIYTNPAHGEPDVGVTIAILADFDEDLDASTLTVDSFTLTSRGAPIAGTVTYAPSTAVFTPSDTLTGSTVYTAEITTDVTDLFGNPMSLRHTWSFATEISTANVDLRSAGDFAVLAKTGISTVPTSAITGDLGLSPAAATSITGFALVVDATEQFSTSTQVTGHVYAADYAPPTPTYLTGAVLDMETAFTDAAGRAADVRELGAGDIGGLALTPGVYAWGTGLLIPTDLTLRGSRTGVWIFSIAGDLTVANRVRVTLAEGALPQNVIWQVAGGVDIGTTAHLEGIVLGQTAITLGTGASVNGRLLAQSAVSMDSATVVEP